MEDGTRKEIWGLNYKGAGFQQEDNREPLKVFEQEMNALKLFHRICLRTSVELKE